jgi:hypothetical protein
LYNNPTLIQHGILGYYRPCVLDVAKCEKSL